MSGSGGWYILEDMPGNAYLRVVLPSNLGLYCLAMMNTG